MASLDRPTWLALADFTLCRRTLSSRLSSQRPTLRLLQLASDFPCERPSGYDRF